LKNKELLTSSEINKIKHAMETGYEWLVNTQRDGVGGNYESDLEPNPICTSYAISRLIAAEDGGYTSSVENGINYLKKFLRNGEKTTSIISTIELLYLRNLSRNATL